eukprot:GGOE01042322.1.p1 GENE.GGOE01042322.1~~GGOE01042322.1.p1  ORF type:complete len:389 (+),score=97.86 GGOE01042322.1:112-1278(+)
MQREAEGAANLPPGSAVVLFLPSSQLPVYKRALMTGVNLYMARALLREQLTGPDTLERSLWAGSFAFTFAPHPSPLLADSHRLSLLDPNYLHAFNLQLLRSMCFEMATLAYVADTAPLDHIARLYMQGTFLVNPISRRGFRLFSSHLAYTLSLWKRGKPTGLRYLIDTLRILQGLYWERSLQLQSFSVPELGRLALCAGASFLTECVLGQLAPHSPFRRRIAFLVMPFLTRAFIFDQVPIPMLFVNWFSLQFRQLVRETGVPSLARIALQQMPPRLPLGVASKPEDNCAFCLEELGTGEVVLLQCGHAHHTDPSEMRWTDSNRRCPICSMPVKLQEPLWKRLLRVVANFDDKDRPVWYGLLRAVHAIVDSLWLRSWWWIAECDFAPLE